MSKISQQLKAIESQLKQQAQNLGNLNIKNNNYLQENQKLSKQINELKAKINKKKTQIDQQNKDKMIIHGKLIKAEREKELLQIQIICVQNESNPKKTTKNQISQQQGSIFSSNYDSKANDNKFDRIRKSSFENKSTKNERKQQSSSNFEDPQYIYGKKPSPTPKQSMLDTYSNKPIEKMKYEDPQKQSEYTSSRGQYQPPVLFDETGQNDSSDSSSEEGGKGESQKKEERIQGAQDNEDDEDDGQDLLKKLRAKVEGEGQDSEDEDQSESSEQQQVKARSEEGGDAEEQKGEAQQNVLEDEESADDKCNKSQVDEGEKK